MSDVTEAEVKLRGLKWGQLWDALRVFFFWILLDQIGMQHARHWIFVFISWLVCTSWLHVRPEADLLPFLSQESFEFPGHTYCASWPKGMASSRKVWERCGRIGQFVVVRETLLTAP